MDEKIITYIHWLNKFPELNSIKKNSFVRILGPFIIGIELIARPHSSGYSPYFIMHRLWKENIKECIDDYIIVSEIRSNNNIQFKLNYNIQNPDVEEALSCSRDKVNKIISSTVKVHDLLNLMDNTIHFRNDMIELNFFESKIYIALYLNDNDKIQLFINNLNDRKQNWNMDFLKICLQKSFNEWFEELQYNILHRDTFLEKINKNRNDKKFNKLGFSELINDK